PFEQPGDPPNAGSGRPIPARAMRSALVDPGLRHEDRELVRFMLRGITLIELILMRRKVDLAACRFAMRHGVLRYPDAVFFALERLAADDVVFISILFQLFPPSLRLKTLFATTATSVQFLDPDDAETRRVRGPSALSARRARCDLRQETSQQVHRHRQDHRGIIFRGYFDKTLQESEVHGCGVLSNDLSRIGQFLRGLKFPFRVNDLGASFALRLRLSGHGALHVCGQIDVLQLYQDYFDPPGLGLGIEDLLNSQVDLFPLSQQLVEQSLPAGAPQRDLGQLRAGEQIILHFRDRPVWVDYPEVENRADFDRDVVARNHVLRRHIHRYGAQLHSQHLFNPGDDVDNPRAARSDQTAEPKNHRPFILL